MLKIITLVIKKAEVVGIQIQQMPGLQCEFKTNNVQ